MKLRSFDLAVFAPLPNSIESVYLLERAVQIGRPMQPATSQEIDRFRILTVLGTGPSVTTPCEICGAPTRHTGHQQGSSRAVGLVFPVQRTVAFIVAVMDDSAAAFLMPWRGW